MLQESPLTLEQMTAMLDNAPVAVFVSDIKSHCLLYANALAKKSIPGGIHLRETTCYHIAGFHECCPFCHAAEINPDGLFVREFRHPVNHRVYQLNGKLIDWEGEPAHIEYILDITEKKKEEDLSKALRDELQETFSSIPCGLCVYRYEDEKICPIFHNPAFYNIMGYSAEHIVSVEKETSYLGVHPEDLPLLQEKIQATLRSDGLIQHVYRLWNDQKQEYRWLQLDGSVKSQPDGSKLLYCIYSDVSKQQGLEKELTAAYEKMQDIINSIPGGVAIYKISSIFETMYFSDGVPELTGYTVEEYQELIKQDASGMIYCEDTEMVLSRVQAVIQSRGSDHFEFRKLHREGNIVWVRAQIKWIGEEDGCPLIHSVFHNISDFKEAQLEMEHLVNSIPGGIASYQVENGRFIPIYYSDGVMDLSGYSREEFRTIMEEDPFGSVYAPDKPRVLAAIKAALESGEVLDVSYRLRHRDGSLIWIHLNGRWLGPLAEHSRFYAVYTGMSTETRLYQSIANESADGIYVIERGSYELLYVNEYNTLFTEGRNCLGQKCYSALHGKNEPCEFCPLQNPIFDGEEHELAISERNGFYTVRVRETDWNGVPAYINFVRDITKETETQQEKERLEQYFETVVKNLPGGIAVVRHDPDGGMVPEYLSDGFAALTGMSMEDAWNLYRKDAAAGIHPEDRQRTREQMSAYIASGVEHYELIYRLRKGVSGYIWVKATFSMIQNDGGVSRVYAVYRDLTKEWEEQEQLRLQYNEMILQHYRTPGPNALVVGHCNISQDRILEISDYTNSNLIETFSDNRERFFTGISTFVVDPEEREKFRNTFLNGPALSAFQRDETEQTLQCFIKLPQESHGRYVQFKMSMVSTPDSGDVTGILTVTDVTEQVISDRILHQLSISGYDFVVDVDLLHDSYVILSYDKNASCIPPQRGSHSRWMARMLDTMVVPRDRERYKNALDPAILTKRLQEEGPYTFSFSITDDKGEIHTKNMTVSAIDLRLGRICLTRMDITNSIREQQGLLNMIAYTFDLAGFININSRQLTMYTRQTVLENLPPYILEDYTMSIGKIVQEYGISENKDEVEKQFRLETMISQLEKHPSGYDFVFSYCREDTQRYKQINVLWGDQNHQTVCLVRMDVTDMLTAERESQKALTKALALAKEANRAKSSFLSAMSHDIRTPMNAIMGMTTLAMAHLDDSQRVSDCLQKISISSKHLLSLVNDILDMSKIERSNVTLNRMKASLQGLLDQLAAIMAPQAKDAGLRFTVRRGDVSHEYFYGDFLRINQILINILSNAVKFTPDGGQVDFLVEEIPANRDKDSIRYRFTIQDTGIGMSEDFLKHIFEPFTRSATTSQIEGTGLGLSITKGLVDLMNGEISVESQPGKGSTFRVELECEPAPADGNAQSKARAETPDATASQLFDGRCILVVEDNAINAEITCGLLDMYGAKAVVKTDGLQAVQAFQNAATGSFDAILMDIQMPNMNGYEASRAIRGMERPDAKTIPIIAMTANAFSEDIEAAREAGMTAHIAKPIDVELLRTTLAGLFKKGSHQ